MSRGSQRIRRSSLASSWKPSGFVAIRWPSVRSREPRRSRGHRSSRSQMAEAEANSWILRPLRGALADGGDEQQAEDLLVGVGAVRRRAVNALAPDFQRQ